MRKPGALIHHMPTDFNEDSQFFKQFTAFDDLNTSSNMRYYDLGDGARLGIGQIYDSGDSSRLGQQMRKKKKSESESDSDSDSSEDKSSHSLGQRLMNLGQDKGFFMNQGSEIKREQFNLKTPFVQLINAFNANEHIRVMGIHTSKSWAIDLCRGNDRMLHVNSRLNEKCIVRNSLKNGKWGKEERSGGQPIKKSKTFTLDLMCESNGNVSIFVNGEKHCDFKGRDSLKQADRLEITSGCDVHMLGLYDEDD